ncbi:Uncharacterised protein [Serratia quinivorans]|jgi:hypothetical protein|nr:Uncharacterised protein [Serratia quinivorans]CAI1055600.1 Uncharacterised protein [Serratia quinivorans]CAI1143096.1 Uncharacterised protein [Serratia quinivorans]CAI1928898.1 Uncharacterised protein [Serratia quinivorans]CAI2148651.1 Uncharacterised protein [Serratia quinivorans]
MQGEELGLTLTMAQSVDSPFRLAYILYAKATDALQTGCAHIAHDEQAEALKPVS